MLEESVRTSGNMYVTFTFNGRHIRRWLFLGSRQKRHQCQYQHVYRIKGVKAVLDDFVVGPMLTLVHPEVDELHKYHGLL